MPNEDVTALLGSWEGYRVQRAERRVSETQGAPNEIWVEMVRKPGRFVCSRCGRRCKKYHDVSERWVRDLPILDAQTWLLVPWFRAMCPACGPRVEYLPWLGKWSRVTKRLAESVGRLCEVLAIKHAAAFYGLGWDTVKQIHKTYLAEKLGPVDLSGVDVIAMDEFAIQKGHRYTTVIVEPRCKRVLWVGRGRGRADIRPFFESLGEEGRERIQVAAMDMNPAYEEEV